MPANDAAFGAEVAKSIQRIRAAEAILDERRDKLGGVDRRQFDCRLPIVKAPPSAVLSAPLVEMYDHPTLSGYARDDARVPRPIPAPQGPFNVVGAHERVVPR